LSREGGGRPFIKGGGCLSREGGGCSLREGGGCLLKVGGRPFVKGRRRPFVKGGGCLLTYELMWWEGRIMNVTLKFTQVEQSCDF
jgi:hypothetical protein